MQGRWLFVVWGILIQLALGTVYSWSVFKKPIEAYFNCSATESSLPFILFLAFFAILMPFGGRWIQKYGPRKIGVIGGILVGAGWILSGFAPNLIILYLTYGLIAGAGVGLVYGAPIAVSTKWFPDKKGLAVGLTVLGFGISALVTAPLARYLIAAQGVLSTFTVLGIAFLIVTVLLSLLLKFPAADWKPTGWKGPKTGAGATVDFSTSQMIRSSSFYALWLCFIIGTTAGLMAIGIASPVGQEIIKLDAAAAAVLVSVFAIFNGIGRPIFGVLTDKVNPKNTAIISFLLIALASVGMLFAGEGATALYVICFAALWLSLGGWLAIAPTATASYFGSKDYSSNYGIIFTAYGIGAIIGNLVSGRVKDMFGSYTVAFWPTLVLAVIGIIVAVIMMKPPKKAL
jgi:MFS family permease